MAEEEAVAPRSTALLYHFSAARPMNAVCRARTSEPRIAKIQPVGILIYLLILLVTSFLPSCLGIFSEKFRIFQSGLKSPSGVMHSRRRLIKSGQATLIMQKWEEGNSRAGAGSESEVLYLLWKSQGNWHSQLG